MAPHSLVQEYLNRTEHVWGIVTNGLTLRLLCDSTLVRRKAYIEFDLQAILEEQRFHDFAALYRLLHRTRLPRGSPRSFKTSVAADVSPLHCFPKCLRLAVSMFF
jgi:hypothetical protein